MTDLEQIWSWPALAGLPRTPPALTCEHGVLGRESGGAAAFQWLAASPGCSGPTSDLAQELALGAEDVVRDTLLWHSRAGLHQAVRCWAPQHQGRPPVLEREKQVLEWARPADLPAALGALVLLPLAAARDDSAWRDGAPDPFAGRPFFTLAPTVIPPAALTPAALAQTIRTGTAELRRRFDESILADLYARLLAGHRGVYPARELEPPGPAVLAALLLPLPRDLADRLSLLGWLPSTTQDPGPPDRQWDLILGGDAAAPPPSGAPAPGPALRARALSMAQALLANDPRALPQAPPPSAAARATAPTPAPTPTPTPTKVTLWGPSGSGKTVFLGQLYWQLSGSRQDDWVVYPGETGLDFLELMRDTMYSRNAFPPGTTLGSALAIVCHLVHRHTGERVTLALEDRAGADYEGLHQEVQERLLAADGIILLLDPKRQDDRVFNEVSHTFERLLLAAGRVAQQDPRPVAVCVTKADELIETPDDYRCALTDPAGFAAAHIDQRLLNYLETRFARFALFPVSAAGVRMRFGAIEPVVFYDELLRPRINCGQPFNLLAPIDWLIRQVGV